MLSHFSIHAVIPILLENVNEKFQMLKIFTASNSNKVVAAKTMLPDS